PEQPGEFPAPLENQHAQKSDGEGSPLPSSSSSALRSPVWQMQTQTAAVPLALSTMTAGLRNGEPLGVDRPLGPLHPRESCPSSHIPCSPMFLLQTPLFRLKENPRLPNKMRMQKCECRVTRLWLAVRPRNDCELTERTVPVVQLSQPSPQPRPSQS
ncbi:hypothetical protein GH733_012363, partial [Mirounga leonina]